MAVGTSGKNAAIVAENLVTADYRGYYSHGMNRLGNRTITLHYSRI